MTIRIYTIRLDKIKSNATTFTKTSVAFFKALYVEVFIAFRLF